MDYGYRYNDYPPQMTQEQGLTLKDTIRYSLFGIVVVGGAFLVGRHLLKKAAANAEQKKTLDEGSAPTYAKQIKMAFHNDGWPGTNKDALRQVLREIPDKKEFRQIMNSYQRLYNSSLLGDMQKALKSTEYDEMLYIVSAKPEKYDASKPAKLTLEQLQAWAKRLKSAFDITYGPFPGTDENAIKAVFTEIPTQAVFSQVGIVYKAIYGKDLMADLKSELEFWEYSPMMQIIYSKPKS